MEQTTTTEQEFACSKCKKTKKESQGRFVLEGTAFCCKECCGDPAKGDHKKQAAGICEFC